MVHSIFELYLKLKKQGHPKCMNNSTIPAIPCKTLEEAEDLLQRTKKDIAEWSQWISEQRDNHPWLLFFSIPRIIQLQEAVKSSIPDKQERLDKILHEVSFLITNQRLERERLQQEIEVFIVHVLCASTCLSVCRFAWGDGGGSNSRSSLHLFYGGN